MIRVACVIAALAAGCGGAKSSPGPSKAPSTPAAPATDEARCAGGDGAACFLLASDAAERYNRANVAMDEMSEAEMETIRQKSVQMLELGCKAGHACACLAEDSGECAAEDACSLPGDDGGCVLSCAKEPSCASEAFVIVKE